MLNVLVYRIYSRLIKTVLKFNRNLSLGENVFFKGWSLIEIKNGGKVSIGSNVTLNSVNSGYHFNMHSPVKLFVDRFNAQILIGDNSRVHGSSIHAFQLVSIGKNCLIAANCQIMDSSGHDLSFENVENRINTTGNTKPVYIEDNVWLGANCIVLPGVRIGCGSVVGAGSVVTKSIPKMSLAAGNPARVIRSVEENINKL